MGTNSARISGSALGRFLLVRRKLEEFSTLFWWNPFTTLPEVLWNPKHNHLRHSHPPIPQRTFERFAILTSSKVLLYLDAGTPR